VVERLVGWLKQRRRIGTRFEKFATRFASMIRMAFLEIYLKVSF
jgi:transposase